MDNSDEESEIRRKPSGGDLIQDIFGSDDEDDDQITSQYISSKSQPGDGWDDSDDDEGPRKSQKSSRLQKSGKLTKKSTKSSVTKKPTTKDIFGSDDEDDDMPSHEKPPAKKRRRVKPDKDVKKKNLDVTDKGEDSGDEYDSGEEVTRTKEDDAFIDEDDEQGYLVREYDEDVQDFRDERPDDYKQRPKKSSSSKKSESRESKVDSKGNDPLSETIQSLKKHKETMLSQSEKESFVKDLMHRMSDAALKDDEQMSKGQPATYKLQMLDGLKKAVALQQLHESLMESDILSRFKEWIEPKNDAERTLPSLTVRTAVYEMLHQLPCYAEHLKRSGIGVTIMALRKHKNEVITNKKLLKDLVEKWCRPLFGKSTDQRSRDMDYNEEYKIAASHQKLASSSNLEAVKVETILTGEKVSEKDNAKARVRTPFNNGYVFTVRPENRPVEKRDLMREKLGESRMNILKMTKVRKGGVKDNFRAVQVDASGRDKS